MNLKIVNLSTWSDEIIQLSEPCRLVGTPRRAVKVYSSEDVILDHFVVTHEILISTDKEISIGKVIGDTSEGSLNLEAPRICCARFDYPHTNVVVTSANKKVTRDLFDLRSSYITNIDGEMGENHFIPEERPIQLKRKRGYQS